MENVTIFACEFGELHISDDELRDAGIISTFLPRWTNPGPPRDGLVVFTPEKNVALLEDFMRLFLRDESRRTATPPMSST